MTVWGQRRESDFESGNMGSTLTPPAGISPQQVNSFPGLTRSNLSIEGNETFVDTEQARKDAFLQLARDRFRISKEATQYQRQEMKEDQNFYCPQDPEGQWDEMSLALRRQQGRPILTINRIPGFVLHVVNSMRQQRPGIKIIPNGDDGADQETADLRQGIIRYIEQNSRAEIVYDCSMEQMCVTGLGWLRVVNDWSAPDSFDQDLFIRWVPNSFSVYWDPFVMQPDWSDMKYAFITEDMTVLEFKQKYGDKFDCTNDTFFKSIGDDQANWWDGQKLRVAEYYYIEQKSEDLCEVSGKGVWFSELPPVQGEDKYEVHGSGSERALYLGDIRIGQASKRKRPVVKWALITGLDIIDEEEWPGTYIPLIPVIGNQTRKNAENVISGMVRYAKEPQRMYNYAYTSFVEMVALTPKAPFIMSVDQIPDGLRSSWENANKEVSAALFYKPQFSSTGSQMVPPPQRQQAEAPIAGFIQLLKLCDDMMKSVFAIYDASLGQRGAQESGLAINARKIESDTGTYNWGDNFIRSLRFLGTILNDLLPHYYNTPGRVIQIIRPDESMEKVVMGQPFQKNGKEQTYDLGRGGRYACTVSTEPNQQTLRQEKSKAMLDLLKIWPQLMQIAGDRIIYEMDFPGKDAIVDRIEKTMPPGTIQKDGEQQQIPPQIQAAMQAMQQQNQMLTQALHEALDKKELERMKEDYATLREQMKDETSLAVASIKAGSEEAKFMNEKIFQEMERMRTLMEGTLQLGQPGPAQGAPPAGGAPAGPVGPQPNLAGPQTLGGEPTVGGA